MSPAEASKKNSDSAASDYVVVMDVDAESTPTTPAPADVEALFLADVKNNASLLEKAVAQLETRFTTRVLRTISSQRRRLNAAHLISAIKALIKDGNDHPLRNKYLKQLEGFSGSMGDDAMQVDSSQGTAAAVSASGAAAPTSTTNAQPEIDVYLGLLVLIFLHDQQKYEEGVVLGDAVVSYISQANRRTMDLLAARVYFYYARFHELRGTSSRLRPTLLALHRTSVLRSDDESVAMLVNLTLRNLLAANLIEQADKFVAKAGGIPAATSNTQTVRYLYYLGRIKAIQLDYTASHEHLQQAIRKAPPTAIGFLQAATKLAVIVQLLMGEVPDRSIFRPPAMQRPLEPYRQLVLAVRAGDLQAFTAVVSKAQNQFQADKTLALVQRMRHNVIKTGMRLISLAYTAISLKDICLRLGLDAEEDAEYIVAKAVRDGVINATVDHAAGVVRSAEGGADVYATAEPTAAFHNRISFCLDLHNQSVKAMRYPTSHAARAAFSDAQEVRDLDLEIQMQLEDDMDEF